MNKEDIIMIGAGYGSQPVVNNFKEFYNFKGYLDDDESLQNKIIEGFPVLGKLKTAKNYDALFIFGISDPYKMQNREKILKKTTKNP